MVSPQQPVKLRLRGNALLESARWNKGTAFAAKEREQFGLTGRLPYTINTLDQQCARATDQLKSLESDLQKNAFLQSLKEQNLVLYYALLERNLRELMPIIYTPTEADAIAQYSHVFRRSEGLYLTFPNRDTMEKDFLEQVQGREIDLVVCSDAEAILGIGDQGVGISTAKAVVYTLIGGVDPGKALPVTLDVGTNNEDLLNDPLYVGWQNKRIRGKDYDEFIDKFVQLVRKYLPHSLLHFEDFGVSNAQRLLSIYRDKHAVFNDDVQGTGAVTLAALMSAVGVTKSKLVDQRIVIFGAGSAGLGIARQLRDAMATADEVSEEEANSKFWLIDRFGLVKKSLGSEKIREGTEAFAREDDNWSGSSDFSTQDIQANEFGSFNLRDVVKAVRPTVLIGTSTVAGAFTEEIIRTMASAVKRPIIFPLSNPSRLHEVHPHKANEWTEGRALIATGSPFPPAKMPNGKDYTIAECNNALIYPGLGLGAIVSRTRTLSDGMIIAGAQRLAALSPALKDPDDALLPDFSDAPSVNFEVAVAVVQRAIDEGLAADDVCKWSPEEVRKKVGEQAWRPVYADYVYDDNGES
ncbi:uncharacterized protein FOMMEDRAFT_133702 [Fomitiporia mediterranea MF3/22]|uniref:uncharacterized protein n=1 Tax=Fomitiporia mediterranea (strain MF3/22) TaxID=694068 RepID=UPI00044090C2|nr:uncharacterized protein FOMMEDRAFT_133702 [Fomitiporia mediterranea MF3/22]EJD04428.1 hypothetical protein FOMMEDRAFT_133702 [Fomitiporia mediterranea MF3/22]